MFIFLRKLLFGSNIRLLLLILLSELVVLNLADDWSDLPPGPYCEKNGTKQCCGGREDYQCRHPIRGPDGKETQCYCDEFCHRPSGQDDCCPDYDEICSTNITSTTSTTTERPTTTSSTTQAPPGPSCSNECENDATWCADIKCIIDDDVIAKVNRNKSLGWHASDYPQFSGRKLKDGLIYKLGTEKLHPLLLKAVGIRHDKNKHLDKRYDSRVRWPRYISPIADQGWCGSDWAVSLASIASDRFAIQSNGAEIVQLSPQTLLSCSKSPQQGCEGGRIDSAWKFTNLYGLLEEHCYPYTANETKCEDNLQGFPAGCKPLLPEREEIEERYTVSPLGRLASVKDAMFEIVESGPVLAVMAVYQDFFHYKGGIYRLSQYGDLSTHKYHSVKIVGWGDDNGQDYWIVANSWGTEWGENGYFRISRGNNECDIESFIGAAYSKVVKAVI